LSQVLGLILEEKMARVGEVDKDGKRRRVC